MPPTGATAYFIELTFPSPIHGMPYVFTTEIRVKTNLPLYAWPFASTIPVGAPGVVSNADLNGIASGLSASVATSPSASIAAGLPPLPVAADTGTQESAPQSNSSATTSETVDRDTAAAADAIFDTPQEEPADLALAAALDDVFAA